MTDETFEWLTRWCARHQSPLGQPKLIIDNDVVFGNVYVREAVNERPTVRMSAADHADMLDKIACRERAAA